MDYGYRHCPKCGKGYWAASPHVCLAFEIIEPDYDSDDFADAAVVYSVGHEEAAERRAGDLDDEGPAEHTFLVRQKGEDTVKRVKVRFECVVNYTAEEEPL